jgi:hypothetical protein
MAEQEINRKRNILSFQPFTVLGNGGGPRILRRLVEGREDEVMFFSFFNRFFKNDSKFRETAYVLLPVHRSWMRSVLRKLHFYLRYNLLYEFNSRRIRSRVAKLDFEILHVLDHSKYANILIGMAIEKKIPVWASFHDHFKTTGSSDVICGDIWRNAAKRMVISEEIGQHYAVLFGGGDYIIVTDGLKANEIAPAKEKIDSSDLNIYFGGLLHIEYYEVFESFCKALDMLSGEGVKISLVLRGTQTLSFLENTRFKVDYRPFSMDNELLKNEMNEADILYLPIKFNDEEFFLYSFSTKMIGYLGASGNIFYHGPAEAAAARFIERENCGLICDSLDPAVIVKDIKSAIQTNSYSVKAKEVANREYLLKHMQDRFFQ